MSSSNAWTFLASLPPGRTTNWAQKLATGNGDHLTINAAQKSATNDDDGENSLTTSSDGEGDQRQLFFDNLLDALGPRSGEKDPMQGNFAACKTIKYSEGFILHSFHVEGAGELKIPLPAEDIPKLRSVCEQAPFGKGSDTLVDTNVRRCWQVDASKLSFPGTPTFLSDTLQPLARRAVRALGFDGEGVKVEAHLYKLLLYEKGGHFTFHRDTEKEKGMFATLILQLPTEEGYTGGKLLIRHHKSERQFDQKVFDCHMVSDLGFSYTVFFADCLHELQKIESGTRLCLAFNLVKCDSSSDPVRRALIFDKVQKVEEALQPWLEEAMEGRSSTFGAKLAIPLHHKYTQENLSFALLKGDDRIVAEVLQNCRDANSEEWLDLHLCLVTKHEIGKPERRSRNYYRAHYDSDSDYEYGSFGHHSMPDDATETVEFKNWIALSEKPPSVLFQDLCINLEDEIVVGEGMGPFDPKPNDTDYEGYLGNSGPTLQFWYYTAMLVMWPKSLSITVACEADFSRALDHLENTIESNGSNCLGQLCQVVFFCERNVLQVWGKDGNSCGDSVTPRLLRFCTRASALEVVIQILELLAKSFQYNHHSNGDDQEKTFNIDVRNVEVVNEISAAVGVFGWKPVSSPIINLSRKCALTQSESFAQLSKQLISMGNRDAGVMVASTTSEVLEARIAELELHKMPVFTWYQPHARLPDYPDVENFLKGPQANFDFTDFQGIAAARSFSEKYFKYGDYVRTAGYSAITTPRGIGHGAFCEIQKTRHVFRAAEEDWHKEQMAIKRLRLELGDLQSAVPEMKRSTMSGHQGSKRLKLNWEITEDAESSTVMDLNFVSSNLAMWSRGV